MTARFCIYKNKIAVTFDENLNWVGSLGGCILTMDTCLSLRKWKVWEGMISEDH